MKTRYILLTLLGAALVVFAIAADKKITDLPLISSPSTGTFIEVQDTNTAPSSRSYLLTNFTRNWVDTGTNSTLAGTAAPSELYTGSFKLYRGALTPLDAGTQLDFGSTNRYWSLTLTGAVTFTTANLSAGKHANVMITGVATNATFTFPAGWIFIGYKPTFLTANKHADLYLKATSGADSGVWAYYGEEQ